MGQTAENLHDAFPALTKEAADRYAAESQRRASEAWAEPGRRVRAHGRADERLHGRGLDGRRARRVPAARDDGRGLAELRTPFRAGGRVTAGNSAGLTDGATAALSPRRRRPRSSGSSRACASSGSPTRASSRT